MFCVTKLIAPQFNRIQVLWVYFKFKVLLFTIFHLLLMSTRVYFQSTQCQSFTFVVFRADHPFIAINFIFEKQLQIFELQDW